jgi:hypothetical protein
MMKSCHNQIYSINKGVSNISSQLLRREDLLSKGGRQK